MNKDQFPGLLILAAILELLCLVLIPAKWLVTGLLVVINLAIYWFYIHERRRARLSDRQRIQQAATIAERNSEYLSDYSPILFFIYDQREEIEWMNRKAQDLVNKYGPLSWNDYLKPLIKGEDDAGKVTIANEYLSYRIDRQKKILIMDNITTQTTVVQKQQAMLPAVGFISVDNYDDVVDKMSDKDVSYLNSFITTFLSDWSKAYHIYFKRQNAERYFFFAHASDVMAMVKDDFAIVDKIRTAGGEQGIILTISIGIAYGDQSLEKIGDLAQRNLDIALVRGGDQVVLQETGNDAKPQFFGGKTTSNTRRTRVRSRAMNTALENILDEAEEIYIMGHRYPDMDAIGAAFGVSCLAEFKNKPNYVVINETELIPDVERALQEIYQDENLQGRLLSIQQQLPPIGPNSVLVMVDYHRPSMSISQAFYEKFEKVVIIDHHRRGEEFPTKPLLTYIESSASSASELVAELVQYESNSRHKIDKLTASLLLAGIFVDTKNFAVRTSARTFDIASYLKQSGANTDLIQYLLSSDLTSFLEISELVGKSEFVTDSVVMATGSENKRYDPVTAAKTADTLLSMAGIQAAFVMTVREDGLIGVSARSDGSINVQKIMEALGGGGHFTNAAAQFKDKTLNEVKSLLYNEIQKTIQQMNEGEK